MFFPFLDFDVDTFSEDAGNNKIGETPNGWDNTLVIIRMTQIDVSGNERVRVYVPGGGSVDNDIHLMDSVGSVFGGDERIRYYPQVLGANKDIRLESINENNIEGKIFFLRLPEN